MGYVLGCDRGHRASAGAFHGSPAAARSLEVRNGQHDRRNNNRNLRRAWQKYCGAAHWPSCWQAWPPARSNIGHFILRESPLRWFQWALGERHTQSRGLKPSQLLAIALGFLLHKDCHAWNQLGGIGGRVADKIVELALSEGSQSQSADLPRTSAARSASPDRGESPQKKACEMDVFEAAEQAQWEEVDGARGATVSPQAASTLACGRLYTSRSHLWGWRLAWRRNMKRPMEGRVDGTVSGKAVVENAGRVAPDSSRVLPHREACTPHSSHFCYAYSFWAHTFDCSPDREQKM